MSTSQDELLAEGRQAPDSGEVEDHWAAWRDACEDVRRAHWVWCDAEPAHSALAYAVLVAATDREACAAEALSRHVMSREVQG